MIFTRTSIEGVVLIDAEPVVDERGWFARTFCAREFAEQGLRASFVQAGSARNRAALTLRGMHWQDAPCAEAKLVRCVAGAVHDVVVDMRAGSPTRLRWEAFRLAAGDHRTLHVPEGCAHGYLTLVPDTELHYLMSAPHAPELARGVRWNDPVIGIAWPHVEGLVMSSRDATLPLIAT